MGWLTDLVRPQLRANASVDDRSAWTSWGTVTGAASSGVMVSPAAALQSSAVWGCVRLIAESVAMLPLIVYRRLSDGGKQRASGHPLYDILHDSPNDTQTAFTFKRTIMTHALLWGRGYAQIVPGPRGPVDQLRLVHPDAVRVEMLPGGRVRYQVRGEDGHEQPINDEDMFVLPGLSLDGVTGLSLVQYARESVGLALAAEQYSARFYSQDATPGGILKHPRTLTPEVADRIRDSWQQAHAGLHNAHQVAVLEEGMEYQSIGINNQDAQLVEQLDWSVADIARFFNVPLHMIQAMTKSTSWGSGMEEMNAEFVVFTLMPWLSNFENMAQKKLVAAPRTYFVEFLVDALVRGKLLDRYQAYNIGRNGGWLSINDVRRLENMNPVPGGDQYMQPLNMQEIEAPAMGMRMGHYQLLLREAALRVVRKEIAAMGKASRRSAGDAALWAAAVDEFYDGHVETVMQTLQIGRREAMGYCTEQAEALLARGVAAMEEWETRRVADLIEIAMKRGRVG